MSGRRRIRIGWLAPEDCVVPPTDARGSISNDIWQLARRLQDDVDILLATSPHPELGAGDVEVGRIHFTRAQAAGDHRRGVLVHRLNQVQRRLGLSDVPYAGRASYFQGYARRHAERFARAGVDVVHLHNNSQWVPVLRGELPAARIVLQMHSEWLVELPRTVVADRLRQVDRVLAVSEHVAGQIRERFPEHAGIVGVLRNGIDTDEFPAAAETRALRAREVAALRRRLGLADGPVILFVGRVSAEKALHVLVGAMSYVRAAVPRAQLLICGDLAGLRSPLPTAERREFAGHPEWRAYYGDHVRRLAEVHGRSVVFGGRIDASDLPLVFALADVYVQPSLFEAFPLAVLEAMASGVPVVAAATGGMPEQVDDGVSGFLVPFGDEAALGITIMRILGDPQLAGRLGCAGRERARSALSWDEAATQLLAVYEELVGRTESAPTVPMAALSA